MKLRGATGGSTRVVGVQREKGEAVVYTRRSRLGWASLNNFGGHREVPSCLVPGPGVIRTRRQWPRVSEPNKGGGLGSGLEGLVCTGKEST